MIRLQEFLFWLRYCPEDNKSRRAYLREACALAAFISPDRSRIWGVDVSDWDGNVNLAVTRAQGAQFAILKATDGTVPMKYFPANAQRAKAAGLAAGAYHWLYPDGKVPCALQAQKFFTVTKDLGLGLPAVVDFEWTHYAGQTANPNYSDLDKWVTEYIRLSGKRPVLYTCAGYLNGYGRMPEALRAKFEGFWFASYSGTNSPTLPIGHSSWDIWQFTSCGDAQTLAPGDRGKLELDLDYMSPAFFINHTGGAMTTTIIGTVVTTSVYVRDAPGGNVISGMGLYKGDKIEADAHQFQWLHLTKINGAPVTRECWASAGALQQYIAWEEVTVPDNPPVPAPAIVKAVVYFDDGTTKELFP